MSEHIGKTCPFCRTEIGEGDAVKVCPACGIAHHETCWNENKGCTTFGCSEQHYEEQHTNPTDVCTNCGAPLGDGQAFCPACGTPKAAKKSFCGQCGQELMPGQEFCPRCGQKVGVSVDAGVNAAINQFNAGVNKANDKKKKTPLIIAIVAVVAVLAIVLAALVLPKLMVSVEDLCAKGDYQKAYEKAEESEKFAILAENVAAVQSAISVEKLKDPSSFELRAAYYQETENSDGDQLKRMVLYISGNNSYGAKVSSYWLYTWSENEPQWELFTTVSSLTEEEYSKYDSDDERLEKLVDNLGRIIIKSAMQSGHELSKDAVKRINNMFEQDILDTVVFIDD